VLGQAVLLSSGRLLVACSEMQPCLASRLHLNQYISTNSVVTLHGRRSVARLPAGWPAGTACDRTLSPVSASSGGPQQSPQTTGNRSTSSMQSSTEQLVALTEPLSRWVGDTPADRSFSSWDVSMPLPTCA
jgi:hypothetical protein